MEYRFKYQIVDQDDMPVVNGSTYLSTIDEFGQCESVELELGAALRYFKKVKAAREEMEKEMKDEEDVS